MFDPKVGDATFIKRKSMRKKFLLWTFMLGTFCHTKCWSRDKWFVGVLVAQIPPISIF